MALIPKRHLARYWPPYLVLIVALVASGAMFGWARRALLRDQQVRFDQAVAQFRFAIEVYFSAYLNILNGLTGFYASERFPTAEEFRRFLEAQGLRSAHLGMLDMGYIACVRPEDRAAILQQARDQGIGEGGLPEFPEDKEPSYVLLQWDNFQSDSIARLAFYVFHEPNRIAAMTNARDTGAVACSEKLDVLIGQGKRATNGFILYAPIYYTLATPASVAERRQQLKGLTFISFSVPECWGSLYRMAGEPGIDLEVYDGEERLAERLWFDSNPPLRGAVGAKPVPPVRHESTSALGGLSRIWGFYWGSLPAFEAAAGIRIPWLILFSGLSVSVVLFVLSWTQTQSRHRAERLASQLQESAESAAAEKERLSVTLGSIGDGVMTLDSQGVLVLMNRAAEVQTGWSQDAARGQPLQQVLILEDPQSHAPLPCPTGEVLATGRPWQSSTPAVVHGRNGAGPTVLTHISPIRDTQGGVAGAVLVLQDITERQHLLQERLRSSRLESMGLLAGGIAHDFNNLLTAITGNVSLAGLDAAEGSDQSLALREAELACNRARDLTQQLLTFAKGGAPIRTTAHVDSLIRESARFATHGSAAKCRCELPEDLWPAEIDKAQISQVIQNIVINAAQAMPEGGTILVQAQNLALDLGNPLDLPAGRYLRISFQDQGCGIRPEHLDQIFDPYFTTKQRGSGLGLATAYSIVKHHEGAIKVASTLGVGSRFDVYLPASTRCTAVSPPSVPIPPPSGQGRILIMDDDPSVLNLLTRILEKLGYQVLAASDGAEAVRLFEEARAAGQTVTAAILDLTVPGGMGGEPTLRQLRAIDPGLKALVSSGYSSAPVMSHYREYGFQAVVPKPYGVESLAKALTEVAALPSPPSAPTS